MSEWIRKGLPKCEKEVLVTAIRKYADGTEQKIITTAIYEDGTKTIEDSDWRWYDLRDMNYNKELDQYFIPEGWWECWEYRYFDPEDSEDNYENVVDTDFIAWMPLPEPYIESEEEAWERRQIDKERRYIYDETGDTQ